MPDPLLYLKSIAAATVTSLLILAVCFPRRSATPTKVNLVSVVAIGVALAAGLSVMSIQWVWPPAGGLDRLLLIVIPVVLGVESISSYCPTDRWWAWLLRIAAVLMTPRVLLHQSIYLGETDQWTTWQRFMTLGICVIVLAAAWFLLSKLAGHRSGFSIPLALCLALLCAGATVMMGGYIKGGAVALPIVGTLIAALSVMWFMQRRMINSPIALPPVILAVGLVSLFGILFIGHFFGRVSSDHAAIVFLAPLLCWFSEMPRLRKLSPRMTGVVRLSLVSIPLVFVFVQAKHDFDEKFSPLVMDQSTNDVSGNHGFAVTVVDHIESLQSFVPKRSR
ncbi:MAG: hypothetical protein KDB00_22765 [Planctomycetales bacterium]|nr:hypothetical protein [Planctomycetales bacterium]